MPPLVQNERICSCIVVIGKQFRGSVPHETLFKPVSVKIGGQVYRCRLESEVGFNGCSSTLDTVGPQTWSRLRRRHQRHIHLCISRLSILNTYCHHFQSFLARLFEEPFSLVFVFQAVSARRRRNTVCRHPHATTRQSDPHEHPS